MRAQRVAEAHVDTACGVLAGETAASACRVCERDRQRTWDEQRREDDQDKSREETAMQCGKCDAAMEEGFVVDYAAGGNRKVAEWVQGEPKGSFWHGVDLSSASQIPIVTYRCAACGYLEFYARGKELGLIP